MRSAGDTHGSRWLVIVGVAVVALVGGGLTLAMTRNGMNGGPDTVAYLSATHNIANGKGITIGYETLTERYTPARAASFDGRIPIVLAPPGYPILTGGLGALGLGDIAATRAVNAVVVVAGLGAAGWMLFALARGRWYAVLGGLVAVLVLPGEAVFGVTQTWLGLATGPASEVPFIACTLVALALVGVYLRRDSLPWAAAAVVGVAAAVMTRYIGTSLTATLVLGVVLLGSGPLTRRVLRAMVLGALTVLPSIAWTAANAALSHANSPRAIAFHPPGREDFHGAALSVADWFLPGTGGGLRLVALGLVAVAVLAVIAGGFRAIPRSTDGERDVAGLLYRALVLFIPCYVVLLLITRSFFDAGVPLRGKSLAPIQPVLVILLIGAAARLADLLPAGRRREVLRIVPVGVIVVVVGALGWHAASDSVRSPLPATLLSADAPGAATLRSVPPGRLIVSNAPDAVFNLTRRSSIAVPLEHDVTTGEVNAAYGRNVEQLGRLLRRTGGTLAIFPGRLFGHDLPGRLGLELRRRSPTVDLYVDPATRVGTGGGP